MDFAFGLVVGAGRPAASLCGRSTMSTSMKNSQWGFVPGHMPTSYCVKCEAAAKEIEGG
jgi:zinc transporter ZupT